MKLRATLSLLVFSTFVAACGTSTVGDVEDVPTGNSETSVTDRPNPPTDRPNPPRPDVPEGVDVPDNDVQDNDVPDMPADVPDMPFDVPPGVDVPNAMIDVPNPPPPDVPVIDPDSGVVCPASGLNDACPLMGGLGSCAPLTAGMRTIDFTGANTGIAASCEGAMTGAGPDGAIPLVLVAASDVSINVTPFGGAATVSVFNAMGCGVAAQERGCFNTNGGAGGALNLPNMQPGTYWVVFSHSNPGGVVTVNTTIMPARPRVLGDACPGIPLPIDGTRVTVNTAMPMFQRANDVGTNCMVGGGGGGGSNGDAVMSYTLMETSDVTINLLPQGGASLTLDVETTCGTRNSNVGACVAGGNGAMVTRTINRQPPGTYYIVSEYRGMVLNPTILASVRAVRSPPAAMADRCPGEPLTFGTVSMIPVASIAQDQAFSCFPASTADGNFNFTAMGAEVLVEVTSSGNQTALELQAPCGMNSMSCTSATVGGANRSWRRYSGLMAGSAYNVHAGTNSPGGTLNVVARTLNPSMPAAVMANEACASARAITFNLNTPVVLTGDTRNMAADTGAPAQFGGGGGGAANCGQCNTVRGRDAVYSFTLAARTRILATARSQTMGFDPVLYVRTGAMCANGNSYMPSTPILFCADDYFGTDSGFDRTLDPGTYYLFLDSCDGFGGGGGGPGTGGQYTLELIPLAP